MDELEALKRSLKRERLARRSAESLLEEKSLQIYNKNKELKEVNNKLEDLLDQRTIESNTFSRIVSENPNPVIRLNSNRDFVFVNNAAECLFEAEDEQVLGLKVELAVLAEKAVIENESFICQLAFGEYSYGVSVYPVIDEGFVNFYFIDQTELKNTLNLLYKGEEKYRTIVELADEIIINTDSEGKIFYLNPKAEHMLGIDKAQSQGLLISSFVHDDFKEIFKEFYMNFDQDNSYLEFPIVNRNGQKVWIGQNVIRTNSDYNGKANKLSISRDITEEQKYQAILKQSEDRYKRVIGNMRLGLLEVDNDDVITYVHEGFSDITGFLEKEIINKQASSVLNLDEKSIKRVAQAEFNRKYSGESSYEIRMKHQNGEWIDLMIGGASLIDEKGSVIGSMNVYMDITEQKLYEKNLKEQTLKAEESSKAKENFLANMSHEIRTPLNAIVGISNLLKNTSLDEKQMNYNNIMITSANNLKYIIDSILDLTKISSGRMTLEQAPMSLKKVIKSCEQTNFLRIQENNNVLKTCIDKRVNDYVLGDSVRLLQILNNLISNAAKFTQVGEIGLSIRFVREEEGKQFVKFQVQDNGIGIEKSKLKHIFASFTQEDESTTRKYGGTGLGLSITKDLVALYGTELNVTSKKGEGSSFTFEIGFEKIEGVEKVEEDLRVKDISGLKILVAEDNKFNQTLVKGVLEPCKVELIIAENGQEAFDYLKNNSVDIVLMDIQMPVMNGIECCHKIRKDLDSDIPIIAVSANAFKEDVENYLASGMNDYLTKPFMPEDLIEKIASWTNSKKNVVVEEGVVAKEEVMINDIDSPLFSTQKLHKMLSGNIKFINESIDTFREHTPGVLDKMKTALESHDYERISKLAHRLKASCNILSVNSLAAVLISIEKDYDNLSEEDMEDKVNEVVKTLNHVVENVQNLE